MKSSGNTVYHPPGSLLVLVAGAFLWNLDNTRAKSFPERDELVLMICDDPTACQGQNSLKYYVVLVPSLGSGLFVCQSGYFIDEVS